MPTIPTLRIQHPDDPARWILINEADYRPEQHQLYREPAESEEGRSESSPPPSAPRPRRRR